MAVPAGQRFASRQQHLDSGLGSSLLKGHLPLDLGAGMSVSPDSEDSPWKLLIRYRSLAIAADVVAATVACLLSVLVRFGLRVPVEYLVVSCLVPLVWCALLAVQRSYEFRFLGTGPDEYRRVLNSGLYLFTVIAVASYTVKGDFSRGYVLLAVSSTVLLTLFCRVRLRQWLYRLRARGHGMQRVLVVGREDAARGVIETMDREPQHGLVAVGVCVPPSAGRLDHVHGVPVIGDPQRILAAVDETRAHVVAVVSHPDLSGLVLRRLSWALEERGVELVVSPGIVEVAGPRLSIRPVAGLSLLHLERPSSRGGRMLLKEVLDRTAGTVLLLFAAPVLLLIALLIKLDDPGPAFFRQQRIGVGGREFTMWKFRSMVVDAESRLELLRHLNEGNEIQFKLRTDPRVTRVGAVLRRFSLDELPQLFNVVLGDMSLVGPRPQVQAEVDAYSEDAIRRLRVRPGMTGLWQVSGRSDLSWEESLRLDLRYVDNWSIALDLSILWRTVRAVFSGAGAY
jgi:exopolysaccharide biosynthesis polyprenyl glycosylphosphotransferase